MSLNIDKIVTCRLSSALRFVNIIHSFRFEFIHTELLW